MIDKLNFFTSIISNNIFAPTTWQRYSKQIFNICDFSTTENRSYTNIICRQHELFGKKTFKITDILNVTKKICNKLVLINSDIEIKTNDKLWKKIIDYSNNALVIGHRFNYNESHNDGVLNENGIDFFVIDTDLLSPHDEIFSLGLCGWDWWLPFLAMQSNIPVYRITEPFLFHKIHDKNWTNESYNYMMNHFYRITGYNSQTYKDAIINYTININD